MKIARQAERSVIITFIFAGSKRPGEKRERERERGGRKKRGNVQRNYARYLYIYISMYITRLVVVMESHNRECFLRPTPRPRR